MKNRRKSHHATFKRSTERHFVRTAKRAFLLSV